MFRPKQQKGDPMSRLDKAIRALQIAQRSLDEAHRAACAALAAFDAVDADRSLPAEERIAARSLKQQTLTYCEHIRHGLADLPAAAIQRKIDVMDHLREELHNLTLRPLPCTRTAASMLADRKARRPADPTDWIRGNGEQPSGPVQRSCQLGTPIAV
jgi:hypothetical protein